MTIDDSLAAWAATVRLGDAEADEIYQRIVATPAPGEQTAAGLDPAWWREFTADLAAQIVMSTRPAAWAA